MCRKITQNSVFVEYWYDLFDVRQKLWKEAKMFEMLRRIQFLWLQSRFDSGYKSRTIVDKQNEIP